ncbi:MAG: zinc-dependent metalloprotease [Myxococcota bacterium]
MNGRGCSDPSRGVCSWVGSLVQAQVALSAALLVAVACTGEIEDIDRTSPNKVQKQIFEGEWWFNATVVDTEFNQGLLFEGLMSGADRIRWDLQEELLVAYRSYETLEGAEEGSSEDLEFQGTVVAMFPIQSHFDVLREYNAATGEQSNIIVENTTDRPWWERDYVRIDWSQNLVADSYSLSGVITAISEAPYYVQEHEIDNPYRPEVNARNINVVGNYILEPDPGVCAGRLQDWWCGASTAKMKLSFMRVPDDANSAYEPLQYPDRRVVLDGAGNVVRDCDGDNDGINDGDCEAEGVPVFERFGFFRTERRRYDTDALWTRDGRVFLANRWNIWRRSRNAAGTTIPYENRDTRTITYRTNVDFPQDAGLYAMNDELVAEWDSAFRSTVAELRKLGGLVSDPQDIEPIFEWKQNSCNVDAAHSYARANDLEDELAQYGITEVTRANLKRACSVLEFFSDGEFTWEKAGDLRHSFLHWVDTPQQGGPLGYGPSASDPVTGEILAGYANVYGATIDTYAAYASDIAALLNGSVSPQQLGQGSVTRETIEERGGFGASFSESQRAFSGNYSETKMTSTRERFAEFKTEIAARDPLLARRLERSVAENVHEQLFVTGDRDLQDLAAGQANNKMERLIGSRIESEVLLTDEIRRVMDGDNSFDAPTSGHDSPLKWMQERGELENQRELMVGEASIMMAEWADEGALWLAEELKDRSPEEIYTIARQEIYRAVQAHEVGHTLGLRHNFEGSWDALNFHNEFWDDYDPESESVQRVDSTGAPTDADKHMYASIMDYMPRPFDDWGGIGKYDRAAIAFGYGQLVEVWEPETAAFFLSDLVFFNDYAKIPRFLGGDMYCDPNAAGPGNCHPAAVTALFAPDNTTYNAGINTYLFEAAEFGSKPASGADAVSRLNSRRYVSFDDIFDAWSRFYTGQDSGAIDVLFNLREVDYAFCPDDRVFASNTECQRWDKGANYREIIADRWERYDSYYWFTNFKRDRSEFNDGSYINSYVNRVFNRHLGPMSVVYQNYLFGDFVTVGETLPDANGNTEFLTLNDFDVGKDWQAAALDGLNYLSTVIHTPEAGTYCLDPTIDTYRQLGQDETCEESTIEIPSGIGKQLRTQWTDEYFFKTTTIGTFWDKYMALFAMTNNTGFFYQNLSDLLDSGSFSLSYWRGLPDEMLRFFASAYDGQAGDFAWRFDASREGGARFVPRPVVDVYENPVSAELPKIEPATSWTLRYYGIALPMARFNSLYDYTEDFAYYTRVCLEDSQDCVDYAGEVERYTDPITGYSYIAPTLGREEGHDLAAQLLREAQSYATSTFAPSEQRYQEARSDPEGFALTDAEQSRLDAGVSRATLQQEREADYDRAKRGVNERTSFLDIIRDLSVRTEFGG